MTDLKVEVDESPEIELEKLKAEIEALKAEKAERKAKEDRLAKIAATPNFKPTQSKLFFRRASEEEILESVPYADVFDDIAVQEIKREATGNKRIITSEEELEAYQALIAEGKTVITYDKDKECFVGSVPVVDAIVNEDPNVVEEAGNTDVAGETDEPENTNPAEG
jgi:hypothetical protein